MALPWARLPQAGPGWFESSPSRSRRDWTATPYITSAPIRAPRHAPRDRRGAPTNSRLRPLHRAQCRSMPRQPLGLGAREQAAARACAVLRRVRPALVAAQYRSKRAALARLEGNARVGLPAYAPRAVGRSRRKSGSDNRPWYGAEAPIETSDPRRRRLRGGCPA